VRDGLVRRGAKGVARLLGSIDLAVTRWALGRRGQPRYRLTGSCNGCGKCCEAPSVYAGFFSWRFKTVRTLTLWWHRVVNGFEFVSADRRVRAFVFRCTHYDAATRRCDSYDSRPLMCRDYPVNLTFEAVPALFPECSHGVVDRNAEALRAAMVAAGVDPEKLEAIEAKLFLSEKRKEPR
jgi:Fe-S-cluster containining protein